MNTINNNYILPQLKPFVEYSKINDKIYFFSAPSTAVEINDSSGFISEVCSLMDGKLNFNVLSKKLAIKFPKEAQYLHDLLTVLDQEGLLEDVFNNSFHHLSDYDLNRWARNFEFFSAHSHAKDNKYNYQEKLKSVKVALLGLGGVGSHILYDITALGVHNICAVDFDRIDLSNLNRQILYNESDIGKLKVEVAKERILKFLPQANLEFHNKKLSSAKDIEKIIKGSDIVISVLDQPRDKIIDWLNLACVKLNIPFMCGAFDSKSAVYYSVLPGKTGCIECWKITARKTKPLFQEIIQSKNFVSSASLNVAISPLISVLTGLILTDFLKIITEISPPKSLGNLCAFDFRTAQIEIIESWEKASTCQICQKNEK
jgi:molybdopterin-synthase adenylyltransferase